MKKVDFKTGHLYSKIFETASDGMLISDLATGRLLVANPASVQMHGYSPEAFSHLRLQDLVHPNSLQLFNDFTRVIGRGEVFEALAQHLTADNSLISVEWRAVAIPLHNRLCALSLLRNVSKWIEMEHQRHQRVGVRSREQNTLLEISQTLASTLELQPMVILEQLGQLIKYTHASLFSIKDSSLIALAVRGKKNFTQAIPFNIRLSGKKTLATIFPGNRPNRITDIWSSEPSAIFLRMLMDKDAASLLEGVQSWMWVPLSVKNRIIGGMGIAHVKRDFFTAHHADLALNIANLAAVTMVNAELYEQAQALAALQERQRLARSLHDAVNQSLFSAGMIAEVLPRLWDRDQVEARKSLEDLRRLTRGAQAEMRAMLAELRPSVLADSSLGDLLRQLADAFTGRTNIPVSVNITGEEVLPSGLQVVLYRICQEGLNNIAKHADAKQVEIDVHYVMGIQQVSSLTTASPGSINSLEMHIRDDGRGFDLERLSTPGHYGVDMMRERAEGIGAELLISSQSGQGTEVTLRWPAATSMEA